MLIFALCVIPIISARFAANIWQAVGLIGLAAAAHQAWSATIFTTASDMFPKRAISSVVGIGSMAGGVVGLFFPRFIGYIFQTKKNDGHFVFGYNIIFNNLSFSFFLGWIIMH